MVGSLGYKYLRKQSTKLVLVLHKLVWSKHQRLPLNARFWTIFSFKGHRCNIWALYIGIEHNLSADAARSNPKGTCNHY
jgi:hypothetical protein